MPSRGCVKFVLVQFDTLWRSHGDAGVVLGFDHTPFDEYQRGWHTKRPLSYPMWMYPYTALSNVDTLLVGDFASTFDPSLAFSMQVPVTRAGTAHGVVVWVDYDLDPEGSVVLKQGPDFSATSHSYAKQAVHCLLPPTAVAPGTHALDISACFTPELVLSPTVIALP